MSQVECAVCNRSKKRSECEVIRLTEAEKKSVRSTGATPLDEYFYCRPCWRIVTDRFKGADLQKGIVQVSLQQIGVTNAEAIATRYRDNLLSITPKEPRN